MLVHKDQPEAPEELNTSWDSRTKDEGFLGRNA